MNSLLQGGAIVNKNGKGLEKQVQSIIEHAGYVELSDERKKELVKKGGVLNDGGLNWYCQQAPLTRNLYEAKFKIDFYLYHALKFPDGLYIESKWQGSQGSVDEKYVFTVQTLKSLNADSILVLEGGGARHGAVRWIQAQAKGRSRFMYFDLAGFMKWAQANL